MTTAFAYHAFICSWVQVKQISVLRQFTLWPPIFVWMSMPAIITIAGMHWCALFSKCKSFMHPCKAHAAAHAHCANCFVQARALGVHYSQFAMSIGRGVIFVFTDSKELKWVAKVENNANRYDQSYVWKCIVKVGQFLGYFFYVSWCSCFDVIVCGISLSYTHI